MALLVELFFFGLLPIAFAVWQIRDVRREQRKREQARHGQGDGPETPR